MDKAITSAIAMPNDANPDGDIFGGWLLSQMDLAAGVIAKKEAQGRVVTIAIDSMVFKHPVKIGDLVRCYARLIQTGTTSMKIGVEAWVVDQMTSQRKQVTEGIFTFVAIGTDGRPRPVN